MSVTAKGKRWETLHSLWIGWTFTLGFFNWVAFLYIGIRARQRQWVLWGIFYLVPFALAMLNPNLDNWLGNVTVLLTVVMGVMGIIHAFLIRQDYLRRLETLQRGDATGRSAVPASASVSWEERRSEVLRTLWIGWTFTLIFNWVAFVYAGFRAKRPLWALWGLAYLLVWVLTTAIGPGTTDVSQWDWTDTVALLAWVASVAHAFLIRHEYLALMNALSQTTSGRATAPSPAVATDAASGGTALERAADTTASVGQVPEHGAYRNQAEAPLKPSRPSHSTKPRLRPTDTSERRSPPPPEVPRVSPVPQAGNELDYRISSSYPFPLAFGFRSLTSIVDHRDLYREQLRIAENMLAFLASVSLAVLRGQDRQNAGINPKEYWRSGISPGDWKDIVGRCSKVFATYEDVPLALQVSRLNIRSEKKGFGQDVANLIRAKNDYKHDRGPTVLEDIAEASEEVQEALRRCMEKLAFFADHPIRQVEDFNVSRSGEEFFLKCLRYMGDHPSFPQEEVVFHKGLRRGDLFLDLDGRDWVPLYPFVVPMTCSHCKARETYFVDLWDPRRGTARMKSFERGHTMDSTDVSEALAGWDG